MKSKRFTPEELKIIHYSLYKTFWDYGKTENGELEKMIFKVEEMIDNHKRITKKEKGDANDV